MRVAAEDLSSLQGLVLNHFTARNEVAMVRTNLIFQKWQGDPILPVSE